MKGGLSGAWTLYRLQVEADPPATRLGDDDAMDQGMAALLAGVGALIGSLLGALAAWRGATTGAKKAVEAAQVQVTGQAEAEHRHWAREQRKVSWMAALKNAQLVVTELNDMAQHLARGQEPPDEYAATIVPVMPELGNAVVELSVWGPEEGASACADLHTKLYEQIKAVGRWREAVSEGREASREQSAYEAANRSRRNAYTIFLHLAAQSLRDPATL